MSTDSKGEFWRKLALLVIDKLLIGLLLLLAGFLLGQQQAELDRLAAERERIRDVTLAYSRIFTEIVADQREKILNAVPDLVAVLNEHESDGRVRDPDDRERLRNVVEEIENAVGQLATANPDLTDVADPFLRLTRRIRSDLVNRTRDPAEFERDLEELLESYRTLLEELRTTSVRAMEDDRRAVSRILASEGR